MKQHKWHKEIKAWADGALIEYRLPTGTWVTCDAIKEPPQWLINIEYRIKPQPKEPQYLYVWEDIGGLGMTLYKESVPSELAYRGKIKLEVDDD